MARRLLSSIIAATALAGCADFVHVPPGTSVEIALARKPEVVSIPGPPPSAVSTRKPKAREARELNLPPVEPTLPTSDSVTAVAEAFTRGSEALEQGRNQDAISAFQQAVQIDPQFGEAWQKLATAYEKAGRPEKAKEASRRAKQLSTQ